MSKPKAGTLLAEYKKVLEEMYPAVQLGKFSDGLANISLRDYFAAQALRVIAQIHADKFYWEAVAAECYAAADAMLAQRAKS